MHSGLWGGSTGLYTQHPCVAWTFFRTHLRGIALASSRPVRVAWSDRLTFGSFWLRPLVESIVEKLINARTNQRSWSFSSRQTRSMSADLNNGRH